MNPIEREVVLPSTSEVETSEPLNQYSICPYSGLIVHQGVLVIAIGVYITLISVMVWRAIARVQFFDDLWTWTKLCSCGGAVVFALSDGLDHNFNTLASNSYMKRQHIVMQTDTWNIENDHLTMVTCVQKISELSGDF